MIRQDQTPRKQIAPLFINSNDVDVPSSSPHFGTPVHPINLDRLKPSAATKRSILPIILPPGSLRPIAFRTFTKKHGLTLNSSALQALATFIGAHCGSGWKSDGLAERVLEEAAKSWKKNGKGVIVDGQGEELKSILKSLEACIVGGKVETGRSLSRNSSFMSNSSNEGDNSPGILADASKEDAQASFGMSNLGVSDDEDDLSVMDPRHWLKCIDAFVQPRLVYSFSKKRFERITSKPSLLPSPAHKTRLFRNRYEIIHQRLLRNELFQVSSVPTGRRTLQRSASSMMTQQQAYKITPIANLLGRSGTTHLLLGMLNRLPTGDLAISDLTGSIVLDISNAKPISENGAWFTPGMIVLVDGMYEEDDNLYANVLTGGDGVGGIIGGSFITFSIGGPPCERREVTMGITGTSGDGDVVSAGGFGWVDFLGVGSEKAQGPRMRRLENRILRPRPSSSQSKQNELSSTDRSRVVILSCVHLDDPLTHDALRKVLWSYDTAPTDPPTTPMVFILIGSFVSTATLAGNPTNNSVAYKEYFDSLASTLSEFPDLLSSATFVFVPGDNDPWSSSFSGGGATVIPRKAVPELFTSRIKRAFAAANAGVDKSRKTEAQGEAIWTSNPARLSMFGPGMEIAVFRDDMSGRLRRNAINFPALNRTEEEEEEEDGDDENEWMNENLDELAAEDEITQSMDVDSSIPTKSPAQQQVDPSIQVSRRLVKTILDQANLSPFPLSIRPVLWDYSSSLSLYPLPSCLILADSEAPPFTITYEGCYVINPASLVVEGKRGRARWVEYSCSERRGTIQEVDFR